MEATLRNVAEQLARARSALFITGAGLSADSGLPTYRGVGGLYEGQSTEDGLSIEEALSGEILSSHPEICWKHIRRIEQACSGAGFNRGHEVIALLEERLERCCVLTQNVDGFHRAAGSTNVIEIHGDVHRLICTGCGDRFAVESYRGLSAVPHCELCHALVRPEVVLFGELLDPDRLEVLDRQLAQGFDMLFSVGTTSVFAYIAEPVYRVRAAGGVTVEINPGRTAVSELVDVRFRSGAAEVLDSLYSCLD